MQEKTKKINIFSDRVRQLGTVVEKGADRLLLLLCIIIFGWLTFYSLRYTEILYEDTEIPWTIDDSVGRNMLVLLVTIIMLLLGKLLINRIGAWRGQSADRKMKLLAGAAMIYVAVICIIWVSICHVSARADGRIVSIVAMGLKAGIFDYMLPYGYMYNFPHQYSLVAAFQILYSLFGAYNYQSVQYMNALCMPLLFYSGYKILQMICKKTEVIIYYILLLLI